MSGEFELVARLRTALGGADQGSGVELGMGDDAAILEPTPGCRLVAATDTLVENVHFLPATDPADLGFKSVAVNLSDLAAMGANPRWLLISLTLPSGDDAWVSRFATGVGEICRLHGVAVVGGDTCRGPLSVTVHALGELPSHTGLLRTGARPGDRVAVTGTLGDAALALSALRSGGETPPALLQRLHRPTPRVAAGRALSALASACIDVSDGLVADAGHLAEASGVRLVLEWDRLPRSPMFVQSGGEEIDEGGCVLGGDDYELCFSYSPGQESAISEALASISEPCTVIGRVEKGAGVVMIRNGEPWRSPPTGYLHFDG